MKKGMFTRVLLIVLAVSVIGSMFMIGGCGKEEDDTKEAALPTPIAGNVFFDGILSNANYKFLHNSVSPDGTKMLLAFNQADAPQGATNGKADLYLVDAVKLTTKEVKKLAGPVTIDGGTGKTVTFRSSWSADGSKIFIAGADTVFVVNGSTLAVISQKGDLGGENHDALSTTDGKFALLALRTKPYTSATDSNKYDGELRLYDAATNAPVGASVSVCNVCHGQTAPKNAVLCGMDGKVEKQADGKYSGTVYVAGHGGHFAKVSVTIDPTNTTSPITATSAMLTVSALKFPTGSAGAGTSQYKLHDPRVDGDTVYWSTYCTDVNKKVHYGKIKTDGSGLVDTAVDVDARATNPTVGVNTMPIYCGSGQTKTAFMPATMTNEAYISVFPKADIK